MINDLQIKNLIWEEASNFHVISKYQYFDLILNNKVKCIGVFSEIFI